MLKEVIPLAIAFIGAGLGAYFAVLKSKKEKLWSERYDAFKSLVNSLESIRYYGELKELEGQGLKIASDSEYEALISEISDAKSKIRLSISTLQILFHKNELEEILTGYQELNDSIIGVKNLLPREYPPDFYYELAEKASRLLDSTTKLVQKKCI